MADSIRLRQPTPAHLEPCGDICFEAFGAVNRRHGFAPEFPQREIIGGLMGMLFGNPAIHGVVAEDAAGRVVGSNFLWDLGPIAGIGPITVDPSAQAKSVGRRMMEAVLEHATEKRFAGVRLVQAAFNTQSMSLYTKLGFDVREPLVCMQGTPTREQFPGISVRAARDGDVKPCCELCRKVHGHDRRIELLMAIQQGTAKVGERGGSIVGYASDVGFFGHVVATDNAVLIALISAAEKISGPGFLLPSRNGEVFRWCLNNGLRFVQPMTLMTIGLYNEPSGAFVPSILF
jgi:GNAT superfamily N-acetyltransferase